MSEGVEQLAPLTLRYALLIRILPDISPNILFRDPCGDLYILILYLGPGALVPGEVDGGGQDEDDGQEAHEQTKAL